MQVRQRVEKLEQRGDSETAVLIVIGEPTPEQEALIDSGRVRVLFHIPDNGRGDIGRDR